MVEAVPETPASSRGLTAGKFRFFNYRYPFNYRMSDFDHLCVIGGKPTLREYEDVIYSASCSPAQGLKGTLFDAEGRRIAHVISTVGPQHVPQTEEPEARTPLCGASDGSSYLYLGRFEPHFGHFITQTVSRFWALNEIDRSRYRLLAHLPRPEMLHWPYVEAILPMFGIGIIGSAMHNVMFSQTRPSLHYLTPRSITQTCLLLDEVFASRSEYARVTGLSDDLAALPKKLRRILPAVRSRPESTFIFKRRLDIALCEKWLKTSEAFS